MLRIVVNPPGKPYVTLIQRMRVRACISAIQVHQSTWPRTGLAWIFAANSRLTSRWLNSVIHGFGSDSSIRAFGEAGPKQIRSRMSSHRNWKDCNGCKQSFGRAQITATAPYRSGGVTALPERGSYQRNPPEPRRSPDA